VQRTAATDDVGASLEPKHDHAPTEAARELTRKARKEKKKKEKKKEKREEKKKKQPASVAAFGDAEMPPVLYPFTFVDVAGSAVATEEMKKKKQHTTTPSTGTQGEHERMARLECGPLACAAVVASLRRAAPGEHDPAGGPVYAAVLEALEVSFYDLQAQAFAGVHVAHEDCFWMTRTAIGILVHALRVRLHLLTAAGAMNWDMGKVDCPIVSIMEHIHACFSVCAEITGIDNLSCTDFIDVTDPVALDEAISRGAHSNSSCGLGRNPGVVLGELIRMSAASS
jgi:hypothetical protein